MSTDSIKEQLLTLFKKSKKDRHRFLSNHLSSTIAAQIYAMRTAPERDWTQQKLAEEAGVGQPRIPVYEDSDYGSFSLATLKKLAYAFDAALVVRFVPFRELADWIANLSPEDLAVLSFDKEQVKVSASATTRVEAMRQEDSPIKKSEPPIGKAVEMASMGAAALAMSAGGQFTSRLALRHSDLKPTNLKAMDSLVEKEPTFA